MLWGISTVQNVNDMRIQKLHVKYDLRKFGFSNRVVNTRISLANWVGEECIKQSTPNTVCRRRRSLRAKAKSLHARFFQITLKYTDVLLLLLIQHFAMTSGSLQVCS